MMENYFKIKNNMGFHKKHKFLMFFSKLPLTENDLFERSITNPIFTHRILYVFNQLNTIKGRMLVIVIVRSTITYLLPWSLISTALSWLIGAYRRSYTGKF
jgi:hypothetical protein